MNIKDELSDSAVEFFLTASIRKWHGICQFPPGSLELEEVKHAVVSGLSLL
jgi:hypothetical protein